MSVAPRRALPHAVRIIGGQWKRSKLPVPVAPGLRPTPDRVRETVFNWLGQDLSGWRCLDAFAGSGALGFEAASRRASEVVLLERNRALADVLQQTRQRLGATGLRVENADALAWMARCPPGSFDLVFLDPPYDAGVMPAALRCAAPLLAADATVYLESRQGFDADALAAQGWASIRTGRAGQVHFALLRRG
jgi:16S rRNA (guanine966-N2)-methyltransferase